MIDSNNIPHVIVPNPINIECVEDLYWFLKYSKEPIYLITGDKVGMGTDNEPLLKNIKIIKEIYLH